MSHLSALQGSPICIDLKDYRQEKRLMISTRVETTKQLIYNTVKHRASSYRVSVQHIFFPADNVYNGNM
jgi:hypothetical protein